MQPSQPVSLYCHLRPGHSRRSPLVSSMPGLPCVTVDVELADGEHKRPAFLCRSSFGPVAESTLAVGLRA